MISFSEMQILKHTNHLICLFVKQICQHGLSQYFWDDGICRVIGKLNCDRSHRCSLAGIQALHCRPTLWEFEVLWGSYPPSCGVFPKGFQYLSVLDLYKGLKILPKHCTNAGKSSDCLDKRKLICGNLTNMTLYNSTLTRFALVPLQDKFQQQILHMSQLKCIQTMANTQQGNGHWHPKHSNNSIVLIEYYLQFITIKIKSISIRYKQKTLMNFFSACLVKDTECIFNKS